MNTIIRSPRSLPTRVAVLLATATIAATVALITACPSLAAHAGPARAARPTTTLVTPGAVHTGGETPAAAAPVVHVARELYTFWNTGKASYLDRAVLPAFHDNTPPAGRRQGRAGILAASEAFRQAVPDLRCRLVNLYVTGHTFTAQLVFSGRFTGTLDGHHGTGQRIRFNAIDIQHVGPRGRITEDWHLEDNLTFLIQAGIVSAP